MNTATTVTVAVVGFFALLALIAFARWLLGRDPSAARSRMFRVGVFVERDETKEPPGERPAKPRS